MCVTEVRQHHARVANHHFAVERCAHAVRRAVEEAHTQHVFELFQQSRRGGLSDAERVGGPPDVAFLLHCREQQQLPRFQPCAHEPVGITACHGCPEIAAQCRLCVGFHDVIPELISGIEENALKCYLDGCVETIAPVRNLVNGCETVRMSASSLE